ncbi:MAG TPA: SMEK domain-containing protein [Armatimonadota bacterium]|nr:SMEK domain-containing protein [Armatimonadota bacterium]
MRSLDLQHEIAMLLSRFSTEAALLQAAYFTDLNRAAQDLLRDILARTHGLPALRNLDRDKPNHPAIDLGDLDAKVAFQVTGDPSGPKIRDTLQTFFTQELNQSYSVVYVFVLGKKQTRYQVDLANVMPHSFAFSFDKHVLDFESLSGCIQALSQDKQSEILAILEQEFGDGGNWPKAASAGAVEQHDAIFVPPASFNRALEQLTSAGLLVLSGPPHVGKTTTAMGLLLAGGAREPGARMLALDFESLVRQRNSLEGEFIILDDPFGAVSLEEPAGGNQFELLVQIAQRNRVVVTTRAGLLEEVCSRTKLGERGDLDRYVHELRQEGAYDDQALTSIITKHIERRLAIGAASGCFGPETAEFLARASAYVVSQLRFPHNLERLVMGTIVPVTDGPALDTRIEQSKDIVRAAERWFAGLANDEARRVAVAALLPWLRGPALDLVVADLGTSDVRDVALARSSGGFLRLNGALVIGHPSYREGVLRKLREDDPRTGLRVLHAGASALQPVEFETISKLMLAQQLLIGGLRPFGFGSVSLKLSMEDYFARYMRAYNGVIENDFPALRKVFEPGIDGPARVHVYEVGGDPLVWSLLPAIGEPEVTRTAEPVSIATLGRTQAETEVLSQFPGIVPHRHFGVDLSQVPEVVALDDVWSRLRKALQEGQSLPLGRTHQVVQLFSALRSTEFPVDEIAPSNPLTGDWIRSWFDEYVSEVISGKRHLATRVVIRTNLVNELDVNLASDLADGMIAEGCPITSDILVARDLEWEKPAYVYPIHCLSDFYSDAQLVSAVKTGLKAKYHALREAIERTFPTLGTRIPEYAAFPLLVECFVDRNRENLLERPWVIYAARTNAAALATPVEVNMHFVGPSSTAEEQDEFTQDRAYVLGDGRAQFHTLAHHPFGSFVTHSEWLSEVSREIWRSLEQFMELEGYRLFKS